MYNTQFPDLLKADDDIPLTAIFHDNGGSWYQNVSILDFTGAKYVGGGGDKSSYKTWQDAPKLSPPTNTHILKGQMPFLLPNQQCKKEQWRKKYHIPRTWTPKLTWGLPTLSWITEGCWLSWRRVSKPVVSPLNFHELSVYLDQWSAQWQLTTDLATAAEFASDGPSDSSVNVGAIKHNERSIATEFHWDTLHWTSGLTQQYLPSHVIQQLYIITSSHTNNI